MSKPKPLLQRTGFRVFIILVLILGAGAYMGLKKVQATQAAPPQPLDFSHAAHVDLGVQCLYCHPNAMREVSAGLPTMEKCQGCHAQIEAGTPALEELARYVEEHQTIEWVPVAIQPDFVYFSHQPHVSTGLNCEVCHGDVGSMTVAEPQEHQNMGWCLECHQTLDPEHFTELSDCLTCHK